MRSRLEYGPGIHRLFTQIFRNLEMLPEALRAVTPTPADEQLRLMVAWQVLSLVDTVNPGEPLSRCIASLYRSLLRMRNASAPDDSYGDDDDATSPAETCCVCRAPIRLDATGWARCSNNHHFGRSSARLGGNKMLTNALWPARCSVTLLAIQEPGTSKHCHLCRRRTMDLDWLRDSDAKAQRSGAGQEQGALSVLDVLSRAFTSCAFCGGRYIA